MGISSQFHGIAWSLSYSDSHSSDSDEDDDEPQSDKVVTLSLSVPLSHLLPGSYAGYTPDLLPPQCRQSDGQSQRHLVG